MWRGAEARVEKAKFLGKNVVVKDRFARKYRIKEIDRKARFERTKMEAKLLHKAKLAGVNAPVVYAVSENTITESFIEGKRPEKITPRLAEEFGRILAKLHANNIIHGDFTPANIIKRGKKLYVIDFGLGFISNRIEDKADDVFAMLRAIKGFEEYFVKGYSAYEKSRMVLKRVEEIRKRARYA
ncbi:MAG: KEOPS complex kinase/ATPase Bud32 [Candidatus Anstonellales archaeon]